MLVTIKNGTRLLTLNATERRQLTAVKTLLTGIARDFAADETDFKDKLEVAGVTLGQLLQITEPEKTTKQPAAVGGK